MNEISMGDWLLKIKLEETKADYEKMTTVCDCLSCQNFREAILYLDEEVLHFSKDLGIDLHKPSQLNAFVVEDNQVMYSGHYLLCGEIVEGEFDEWDIVVGKHCFSLVKEESNKYEKITSPYFLIGFEVVLPWILSEATELMKK